MTVTVVSTIAVLPGTGKTGRIAQRLRDTAAAVRARSRRGTPSFDWTDEATGRVQPRYKDALAEADTLKPARDQVVYDANLAGASDRELPAGTGLSVPPIQRIINRARKAAADQGT